MRVFNMKDETMMPPRSMWHLKEVSDERFLRSLQYDENYLSFEEEFLNERSCGDLRNLGKERQTLFG